MIATQVAKDGPAWTMNPDGTLGLFDIRDTHGFVAKTIRRSGLILDADSFEELKAEGLLILAELARRFEPHRAGYAQAGRFSGYAAAFLPRRLQDAWARMNPQHRVTRTGEGKREWEYGQAPISLHAEGLREFVATQFLGPSRYDSAPDCATVALRSMPYEPPPVIARALRHLPAEYAICARPVIRCIDEGFDGNDEIARQLRMNRREVADVRGAIASAIHHTTSLEAA